MENLIVTDSHKLTLEKTSGQWWLELIDRATGMTQIVYFARKDKAKAFCKGMSIPDCIRVFSDVLKIEPIKMYKEGV